MRLFWKDHIPLLLFYLVQIILVPLLYWLTGEGRPFSIVVYGALLSSTVLAVYLSYRYFSLRRFYTQLNNPLEWGRETIQSMGESPLPDAVNRLFSHCDQYYQEELHRYRSSMEQHVIFINRWVHQMKTPISVIQLTVQDLEDTAADGIMEDLEKLRKGLEMVIYTSRLERFEQDFIVENVSLQKVVNQAVAENRRLFIRKGVTPNIQLIENWPVYSDRKWLQFMVGQILINAVNYTEGSGKNVYIHAYQQGDSIILEIRDEGIGITKEDLKRVFNPYYTGERGRQYHESTGMGLYLVREICNRLGHRVELDSEPRMGTTVRLEFSHKRVLT
ncbi:Signal transduction histidine kinase [Paenibacillus tianmuensis]|uniref:histidine kinase n=1 Tax=Paenibacillus tianmuensis TaxID=624147 RepID=A0A1G4S2K6_9BACL|nr:sensor histidine kinase [Paenibacillus tianmuensis]SCW63463.1 Signal transduction histidine kinase [Paenibacillus tianmuensis]